MKPYQTIQVAISAGILFESVNANPMLNITTMVPLPTMESGEPKISLSDIIQENKGFAIGLLVVILVALGLFYFLQFAVCARSDEEDVRQESDEEMGVISGESNASRIARMDHEDRVRLYNEAFDRNRHQTVLKDSQIIVSEHDGSSGDTNEANEEEDESPEDADESSSIYLSLEEARSSRKFPLLTSRSSIAHEPGIPNPTVTRKSSIVHPRKTTAGASTVVRGNCVICFENILAGETVVWSESKSCSHVYHKECMVNFLAHRAQSAKELELDGNPCPTCRQPFLTIDDSTLATVCIPACDASTTQSVTPTESSDGSTRTE